MPISEQQLEADRRNAQLSSGTSTEEGKARSAMNGFSNRSLGRLTAIMTEEDRLNQNEFVRDYIADLDPRGAVELQLARTLALDNWRLNRIKAVEENIFAWGHEVSPGVRVASEIPEIVNALTHAGSYLKHSGQIDKISLYEARLNRIIARNMELLMQRQARRFDRAAQSEAAAAPMSEARVQTFGAGARDGTRYLGRVA